MRIMIVLFHLPEGSTNAEHKEFARRLYGRATSTWGGKYRYQLKGLLDEIPHARLFRGAVLVRKEDLPELEALLKDFSAEYVWREIKPLKEDVQLLSRSLK